MKTKSIILTILAVTTFGIEAKTKVTVSKFENKTGNSNCRNEEWAHWQRDLGSAFQEMLMTRLSEDSRVELLDRENINNMYEQEFKLVNSEEAQTREKGKFKSADIAFVGAVTEFEYCAEKNGASIDVGKIIGFGSVKVGGKGAAAKVRVDIRAVDVRTGAVLASVRGEGKTKEGGFGVDIDVGALDFDLDSAKQSPLGQASREAIEDAADKLLSKIRNRLKSTELSAR